MLPRKFLLYLIVLFISLSPQLTFADSSNTESGKPRLVLMPLRLGAELQKIQGAMETSLIEGLQEKYEVFAGERVRQKASEIFKRETVKALDAHKDCDETRCLQNVAAAFQSELITIANVTKVQDGYLLALSITNIFDEKSVYSKSSTCKDCSNFQLIVKLKELTGKKKTDDEEHLNYGVGALYSSPAGFNGSSDSVVIYHIDYDLIDLINTPLSLRVGTFMHKSPCNPCVDSTILFGDWQDSTSFFGANYFFMYTDKFHPFIGLGVFHQIVTISDYVGVSSSSANRTNGFYELGFQYAFASMFNIEFGYSNLPNDYIYSGFKGKPQLGFNLKF